MDLKKLRKFINFMDENNLSELEIEEEQQRIRLKKYQGQPPQVSYNSAPQTPEAKSEEAKKENVIEIKSPMVGTFYRAPSPEAKPYVEIGQDVAENETVCIVEAMKVMNEIKAGKKGKIAEILVENGQAIEFGQTLFTLAP